MMQVEDERRHADQYKEQVRTHRKWLAFAPSAFTLLVLYNFSPSICASDGEGELSHEAAEASIGGGGGGGHQSKCRSQEAAEGAGRCHRGQRGSHPRGHLTEEPPQVQRGRRLTGFKNNPEPELDTETVQR